MVMNSYFSNTLGNIYELSDLLANPQESQKESYMLILDEPNRRTMRSDVKAERSPKIENISQQFRQPTEEDVPKNSLIIISNFSVFEKNYLRHSENCITVIFIIDQKEQLKDINSQLGNLIKEYSSKFDFFCYMRRDSSDIAVEILVDCLPSIAIFNGSKKFMEIPFDLSEKALATFLNKLQPADQDSIVFGENGPETEDLITILDTTAEFTGKNNLEHLNYCSR